MYEASALMYDVRAVDLVDLCGSIYLVYLALSVILMTGFFVWGMFGNREQNKKIIFAELLLFFVVFLMLCNYYSLRETLYLFRFNAGLKPVVRELNVYFSQVFLLSAVSLYKLVLLLILMLMGKREKGPEHQL